MKRNLRTLENAPDSDEDDGNFNNFGQLDEETLIKISAVSKLYDQDENYTEQDKYPYLQNDSKMLA